jgi:hypothetical protein
VVATSYLLGVSTRRVEKLAGTLGIKSLSKRQVSELAKSLDQAVEQFRSRPLDAGPYRFVQADTLTLRVREGGRTVLVHGLIATGVNADGKREILGFEVTSAEDGAGWLAFFRGLVAGGLSGVVLVTSNAHAGLVAAIAATCRARAGSDAARTEAVKNQLAVSGGPGVRRGCRGGQQVAAGAVAGWRWRGDMPGLAEEWTGLADGVADRGPADSEEAGQHVRRAQVPLVEDGQQDAFTVADLLVEDAAAGIGLTETAAPLIGETLGLGPRIYHSP